jgi:hypothetical protein
MEKECCCWCDRLARIHDLLVHIVVPLNSRAIPISFSTLRGQLGWQALFDLGTELGVFR